MKKYPFILTIAFIYLLLGSRGCENGDQLPDSGYQKRIERNTDSIVNLFCSDEPSAIAIVAFEEDAKIRFSDFLDYLQILADTGIAPVFSSQASKMISKYFLADSLMLCFINPRTAVVEEISIADLVTDESKFHTGLCVIRPDSVWLTQDIQRISETTFLGVFGYKSHKLTPLSGCVHCFPADGNMEFYVTKREKIFGHDTLMVWSVLLGENSTVKRGKDF